MFINILKARTDGREKQESFDFIADDDYIQNYKIGKPVKVQIAYSVVNNDIYLDMQIDYFVETPCDLCGGNASFSSRIQLSEVIRKDVKQDDSYVYTGDSFCVDEIINQAILLDLPTQILCKPDCKGLCFICGKDKNKNNCNCEKDNSDNPFNILLNEKF